jgi:hypothetical protein
VKAGNHKAMKVGNHEAMKVGNCQGTPAAYLPMTGQGRLNECGSAKAS